MLIIDTPPYRKNQHLVHTTMVIYYTGLMHSCIFLLWCKKGHNPKHTLKILKSIFGKRLSEYIYNLLFSAHILQSDFLFCNIWYLIKMCLVLKCNTGFLDIFTMLVLSQCITISSLISILISFNIFFIQMTWLKIFFVATYSSFDVHWDV